jgi:hypothetical protein
MKAIGSSDITEASSSNARRSNIEYCTIYIPGMANYIFSRVAGAGKKYEYFEINSGWKPRNKNILLKIKSDSLNLGFLEW